MGAEKIVEHCIVYEFCNKAVALVSFHKSCIAENPHCKTPSRTLVASVGKGGNTSLFQIFVVGINLSEGIKAKKVRNVAVLSLNTLIIEASHKEFIFIIPLFNLSPFTDT